MNPESIKIDFTILEDGYILMYKENLKKFVFVDPDLLLSKSVKDGVLPDEFLDQLDVDLNDRINLDAGKFKKTK